MGFFVVFGVFVTEFPLSFRGLMFQVTPDEAKTDTIDKIETRDRVIIFFINIYYKI